ncbi:MAG: hypothetical protein HYU02_08565, partial [Thaumarchaeota archaeon]|nr:hypothetical protein [Nitrososphaerota archaeon]
MVEVEVIVKRVNCASLSKSEKDSDVTFDVNASLAEIDRNEGSLALRFDIEVETQPPVAKLSLAGSATLRGESEEIQNLVTSKDGNSVPPVFMKIYQKVYATMYL